MLGAVLPLGGILLADLASVDVSKPTLKRPRHSSSRARGLLRLPRPPPLYICTPMCIYSNIYTGPFRQATDGPYGGRSAAPSSSFPRLDSMLRPRPAVRFRTDRKQRLPTRSTRTQRETADSAQTVTELALRPTDHVYERPRYAAKDAPAKGVDREDDLLLLERHCLVQPRRRSPRCVRASTLDTDGELGRDRPGNEGELRAV